MKRSTQGEVKLMHDQLTQVEPRLSEDIPTIYRACDMLLELADENAKLIGSLHQHMDMIMQGSLACQALAEKYKTLLTAVKNLRDQKGRHNTQLAYERLIAVIGEEK